MSHIGPISMILVWLVIDFGLWLVADFVWFVVIRVCVFNFHVFTQCLNSFGEQVFARAAQILCVCVSQVCVNRTHILCMCPVCSMLICGVGCVCVIVSICVILFGFD